MATALPLVFDSVEQIAEPLREYYEERDGKFHLAGIEDAGALKRALENERRDRKEAKAALEKLKGIDPDEYARLKQEAEQRETDKIAKKGEWDKLREQLLDKHKTDITAKDGEITSMRSALESHLIDAEATRAIAAAKGSPELLLPHVRRHVQVIQDDGHFVVRVVDKDGNARIGSSAGEPMTITELVTEMRGSTVFGRAFDGNGPSGGGAPQSKGGGAATKAVSRAAFDSMTAMDRSAHIKSGGTVTD